MQIDSNNLIRKLPAMIQGRCKFAKIGKKSWTFCPHCGARMIYGERKE